MLILNFTHPLTEQQRTQIESLAGTTIAEIRTVPMQISHDEPLGSQIVTLVDAIGLSSEEWQTCSLLVNPPGYAPTASALLAELHGRIGHFPSLLCLRPRPGTTTIYEVAELLNLQSMRNTARLRR